MNSSLFLIDLLSAVIGKLIIIMFIKLVRLVLATLDGIQIPTESKNFSMSYRSLDIFHNR